jgi:hypothetical protein
LRIDPKLEDATRDLLGHTVRGEWDELARVIQTIGEERYAECLALILRIAGYVTIDVVGHEWPTDAKLHKIASVVTETDDMGLELQEADVYVFLSRVVLGFEPLVAVFTAREKIGEVTTSTTAALLVYYRPDGKHWWEYLDQIEQSLEVAADLSEAVVPALLLLTRRQRALRERGTEPS